VPAEIRRILKVKKWLIPVIVVVVIAVAVGGFFGGRATGGGGDMTLQQAFDRMQKATPEELQQQFQNSGRNGANGGAPGFIFGGNGPRGSGGNLVTGSIISADGSSITVKTADGSTKIVLVSGSTTVTKSEQGSVTDLTTGQNVIVTGTSNSDGTVTATRVQVGANLPDVQGGVGAQSSPDQGTPPGAGPGGTVTTVTP
jgi:hypothetical protein